VNLAAELNRLATCYETEEWAGSDECETLTQRLRDIADKLDAPQQTVFWTFSLVSEQESPDNEGVLNAASDTFWRTADKAKNAVVKSLRDVFEYEGECKTEADPEWTEWTTGEFYANFHEHLIRVYSVSLAD
jgi:hypothetical protein